MDHFTAHRLQFEVEVRTPLELNAHQGSAIRGALYHALRDRFCTNRAVEECRFCPLNVACPVCTLVSTLSPGGERGDDVPRPYTVQPPLAAVTQADGVVRYEPGQTFGFGLTLFSQALSLFPYVIMAVHGLERGGIGRKVADHGWRRGAFTVRRVWAENPLTGEQRDVLRAGQTQVTVPDVPITHAQVLALAGALRPAQDGALRQAQPSIGPSTGSGRGSGEAGRDRQAQQATLNFLTPTRLIAREQLVKPDNLSFRPIIHRLLDRLERLSRDFSDTPLDVDFRALLDRADAVRLVRNATRWIELSSYSTRQGRATPISGLVGQATFEADDFGPFLPWLLWGQFVHVGKDAVKGNGWYRLEKDAHGNH
jgi:hypothetical protein